jgi:hypothetical protein
VRGLANLLGPKLLRQRVVLSKPSARRCHCIEVVSRLAGKAAEPRLDTFCAASLPNTQLHFQRPTTNLTRWFIRFVYPVWMLEVPGSIHSQRRHASLLHFLMTLLLLFFYIKMCLRLYIHLSTGYLSACGTAPLAYDNHFCRSSPCCTHLSSTWFYHHHYRMCRVHLPRSCFLAHLPHSSRYLNSHT